MTTAIIRLKNEYEYLQASIAMQNVLVVPDSDNPFEWHFCIFGLASCDYEGGVYHGKILYPQDYPSKPP